MKSAFWSIGKYVFAAILLYVILSHAQLDQITGYLKRVPPSQLLLGFAFVSCAQLISALRMRFFFRANGFPMSVRYANILFYVGALYNFLLPGGIGGDAYKVILVRKRMSVTTKDGICIMLADRASGLCIILLTLYAGMLFFDLSDIVPYAPTLLVLASVVTVICYVLFSKWLLKQKPAAMLGSLVYSLLGQTFWICTMLTIWSGLGIGKHAVEYIVLYCAASVTGMLPLSVGGLGIKETTYYYGAELLRHYAHSGVDGNLGIAISLCIFVLNLAASLPGVLWINKVEKADFLAKNKESAPYK